MATIANETTAPARVVRLPVRCDNCGKDRMDVRMVGREALCESCAGHAADAALAREAAQEAADRRAVGYFK